MSSLFPALARLGRRAAPLAAALTLALGPGPAAAMPPGFVDHHHNGTNPKILNGVTTFYLPTSLCSDEDYINREVNDCYNGNTRSQVKSKRQFELGDAARYSFQIYIDPSFTYGGGPNRRSSLSVADWRRDDTSQNNLYRMYLDDHRGLQFEETTCVPPSGFGDWHQVVVSILWHREHGILQVECDGRVVIAEREINTAVPADCAKEYTYQCTPGVQQLDHPIEMRLGLLHQGYGPMDRARGLSPEGRRLLNPVEVKMRDMKVERLDVRAP